MAPKSTSDAAILSNSDSSGSLSNARRPRKPRILCLHGGGSNNDITELQVIGLNLHKMSNFKMLQAPHLVPWNYPGLKKFSDGPFRCWSGPDRSILSLGGMFGGESQRDKDWNESLEYVARYLKYHGPFDGVYGFSQGCAMITHFSHPSVWRDRFGMEKCPWSFCILACGGASTCIPSLETELPYKGLPSFHIFGIDDPIQLDGKAMMNEYWDSSLVTEYTHERGHEIDMQMMIREPALKELLEAFLEKHYYEAEL